MKAHFELDKGLEILPLDRDEPPRLTPDGKVRYWWDADPGTTIEFHVTVPPEVLASSDKRNHCLPLQIIILAPKWVTRPESWEE